jgi:hypothetical protein
MTPFLFRFNVLASQAMNTHAAAPSLAPSALIAAGPSVLLSGSRIYEFKGPFSL